MTAANGMMSVVTKSCLDISKVGIIVMFAYGTWLFVEIGVSHLGRARM